MYRRSNLLEKLCLNPLVAWQCYIVRETSVRRYSARPMQRLQVFRPVLFPAANEHDPKPLQFPKQSTISFDKRILMTNGQPILDQLLDTDCDQVLARLGFLQCVSVQVAPQFTRQSDSL